MMQRYRGRGQRRGGRLVQAVAAGAIRRVVGSTFSRIRNAMSGKKDNPQRAVTNQHDFQVQKFSTRKLGKSSKRKKKFRQRVMNALTAYSNPAWIRFYDQNYQGTIAAGTQQMFILGALYGLGGAANGDNRDLEQIMLTVQPKGQANNSTNQTVSVFDPSDNKLRIQSAYMECNIRTEAAYSGAILDVYECICRKTMTQFDSLLTMLQSMPGATFPGTGSSAFTSGTLGITLFQSPPWVTAMRILSKTRYKIEAGSGVSIKMNGHRTRTITGEQVLGSSSCCLAGYTKVLVGVVRGPTSTVTSDSVQIRWDALRMYNVDPNSSVYPITGSNVST